jgi:hypothetical protein
VEDDGNHHGAWFEVRTKKARAEGKRRDEMTKDDITRMAREAGFVGFDGDNGSLRRFAALVAAAEREVCAKLVENYALQYAEPVWAFKLTAAIRARG